MNEGSERHSRERRVCISVDDDLWARTKGRLAEVLDEGAAYADEFLGRARKVHDAEMITLSVAVREVPRNSDVLLRNEAYRYAVPYSIIQELADLLRGQVSRAFLEPFRRRRNHQARTPQYLVTPFVSAQRTHALTPWPSPEYHPHGS